MIFTDNVECAKDLSQKLRDQVAFCYDIVYCQGNMNNNKWFLLVSNRFANELYTKILFCSSSRHNHNMPADVIIPPSGFM